MTAHSEMPIRAELARAKVNLALHVTGQRPDGMHLLDSLVAFPHIGDRIAMEFADRFELVLEGPFGRELQNASVKNLIKTAVETFAEVSGAEIPPLRITLTKRLPIASGIGGGSSDAATTLRLLEELTGIYLDEDIIHDLALSLGADVPVCLEPEPQFMRGIGEEVRPAPTFPACGMVLVNPKIAVETPAVFKCLASRSNSKMPNCPDAFGDLAALTNYLAECRNDLQDPAIKVCPEIADILTALEGDRRIQLARMSGSGATCFALCEKSDAMDVERDLRASYPDWWIASGPLS